MCFLKKIHHRISYAIIVFLLGIAAIVVSMIYRGTMLSDFLAGFYSGTGGALAAFGIMSLIRQIRLLCNEEKRKKAEIDENDERTRFIAERTDYVTATVFLPLLYVASLVAGFFDATVFLTLLGTTVLMVVIRLIAYLILKCKY